MRRAFAVVALVLLAACSSNSPFAELPEPEKVDLESTTTTSEVDFSGVALAPVQGSTTTSVALGPGPMTIVGHVEGPDGPIAGAVVQLERLVGDGSASTRVPTAADGTWNLEKVNGGRYRIRAWRVPDLVSKPQIVFIETNEQRVIDVRVELVGGVRVDAAVAPDPPIVGEEINLKVRVAERTVDAEGLVRDEPVSGVRVRIDATGDWEVAFPNPSTTGGDGSTIFRAICEDEGVQPLFATMPDGNSFALTVAACVDASSSSSSSTTSTSSSTSTSSTSTSTTEP